MEVGRGNRVGARRPVALARRPDAVDVRPDGSRADTHAPGAAAVFQRAPRTPERVLSLQAAAGNRAVCLLVARDHHTGAAVLAPPEPRLSSAQLATARAYYARRRQLYDPSTVAQIRAAVGAPAGERMDEDAIRAVARWQAGASDLAADGIAAERTLAQMFPSGLASQQAIDAFETDRTALAGTWAALATPEARWDALIAMANERLTALGVPPARGAEGAGNTLVQGTFRQETWALTVHPSYLRNPDPATVAYVTRTVYHEARHAEQFFVVARYRAGQGLTAAQLQGQLRIPAEVAAAAAADPLPPGSPLAVTADGWYRAMYGARVVRLYRRMAAARTAYYRAQDALEASPTPANERRAERAHLAYERADAAHMAAASEEHDARVVDRRLHAAHDQDAQ